MHFLDKLVTNNASATVSGSSPWWVYIVQCADQSLYTGIATDLMGRIKTHNSGKGAKYTKTRLPVTLVYQEPCVDRSSASRREYAIKQLTRKRKLALIAQTSL
jgi:predicted GIY-YIG superfamily endonuclease